MLSLHHAATLGLVTALVAGLIGASGCGEATTSSADGPHSLPAQTSGKDDNYISTFAREFIISGQAHVSLPEGFESLSEAEREEKLTSLTSQRASAVMRSVQSHVDSVVAAYNGVIGEEDSKFFTYFKRRDADAGAFEVLDDGRARFDFELEFVGSFELIDHVAPQPEGEQPSAERIFSAKVTGVGGSDEEQVEMRIAPSPSRDAFPKYDELFADGIFDIAIHFGGDYNEGRYDIETAKWTVEALFEGGFENAQVKDFETLTIDSPPFTRTLLVEGREVEVQVKVVHADLVDQANEQRLADSIKHSLKTADIVMYSGHAGPDSGFVLDYHPNFELDNDEFATLELAEKYQIYVFDGCQTYRTYVDDMMKNPAKTFDNVDIVTTVNTTPFSVGYQVIHQFLHWFTITSPDGTHYPLSWQTMLQGINTEEFDDVHYGVHGIDQDPQLNPNGGAEAMCRSCSTDADCGGGGNFCLAYPGASACGVACTSDQACGAGFECKRLNDEPELFYLPKQCIATAGACGA